MTIVMGAHTGSLKPMLILARQHFGESPDRRTSGLRRPMRRPPEVGGGEKVGESPDRKNKWFSAGQCGDRPKSVVGKVGEPPSGDRPKSVVEKVGEPPDRKNKWFSVGQVCKDNTSKDPFSHCEQLQGTTRNSHTGEK